MTTSSSSAPEATAFSAAAILPRRVSAPYGYEMTVPTLTSWPRSSFWAWGTK